MSNVFKSLNAFLEEVGQEKQAAANTEAGGYTGGTSHPVKDVEDGTKPATTGARASENESDNKSHMDGRGEASVDSTSEETPGGSDQDKRQLSGKATGEDPAVEDDYKSDKDDPGTTHPAKTDDGEKYASVDFRTAHANAIELGNAILADIATGSLQKVAAAPAKAAEQPAGSPTTATTEKTASDEVREAAELGYNLASVFGMEKMSAEERTRHLILQTVRDAEEDAACVAGYLSKFAEDSGELGDPTGDAETSEDHSGSSDADSGKGGSDESGMEDPAAGGGGGAPDPLADAGPAGGAPGGDPLAGLDPQQLMALLQALVQSQGGGMPPGGEGGGLPGGLPGGMPPGAGGGAPVPGAGGGPVGEEEAMSQLAGGMGELGVSEQELAGAGPAGEKLASAVKAFKRSGKYQLKEASTPRDRQLREFFKSHVRELLG